MILVSLRISGCCVEIMLFNGSMNGGIFLKFDFDIYSICLVIMCNYLAAYAHIYLAARSNMRALRTACLSDGAGSLRTIFG